MDDATRDLLWKEYSNNRNNENRDKIILEYAPLVKIVAGKLSMYLIYNIEYDDLVGYGIFGLIDAIDKFDLTKDVKFETYATLRIRGAILDQVRKMDWIPRSIRQKIKTVEQASREIEMLSGRKGSDKEIADKIGISEEEYHAWQANINVTSIVSLNEHIDLGIDIEDDVGAVDSQRFESPEQSIEKEELATKLNEALGLLTEKERRVIELYYYEDLTLREISYILEVTESRISQVHTKALLKMKDVMGKYMGVFRI